MADTSAAFLGNIATLRDKVALVTGGSSGLGRAICQAYAAAGAYVVSADLSPDVPSQSVVQQKIGKDSDLVTPTVELINKKWPAPDPRTKDSLSVHDKSNTHAVETVQRAMFVQCDVGQEDHVRRAVQACVERYGRLDVMVNNAGISAETTTQTYTGASTRTHETDVSILDRTLAINVRGVWLGTKHAVQQFLTQKPHPLWGQSPWNTSNASEASQLSDTNPSANNLSGNPSETSEIHRGWIINIASILSSVGLAGSTTYCASKGAVLQLTRSTALEYAADGIHINAIQPGFVDTHILESMYQNVPGIDQTLKTLHPWGRTGRPEEIARMAVYLAGEGASWVTGSSMVVDGGYLAQ